MRAQDINNMRTFAQAILQSADKFDWSIQGMGMLRLYLPNNTRLHVWDSRYRVPDVSMIHDHLQWGLRSTVIAGQLQNTIYSECVPGAGYAHMRQTLKAGYGCQLQAKPKRTWLRVQSSEVYFPGESYAQTPAQIHRTDAADGTVTIMQKRPADTDEATVFWEADSEWVSAEPRKATPEEVKDITEKSLALWFPEQ